MSKTPKFLYRYCAINNFSLNSLFTNTIFVSDPSKFNDPYDSTFALTYNLGKQLLDDAASAFDKSSKYYENYKQLFDGNLSEKDELCRYEIYRNFCDAGSLGGILLDQHQKAKEFVRNRSVACLSALEPTQPKAILMWSHYAEQHKGICLAYNKSKLESALNNTNVKFILEPVVYKSNRNIYEKIPDSIGYDFGSIERFLLDSLFRKANFWRYEKEYRLVAESAPQSIDCAGALEKIYFGTRTPSVDMDTIFSFAFYNKISLVKTDIDYEKYRIKKLKEFEIK